MKTKIALVISILAVAVAVTACRTEHREADVQTGTIAPATPQAADPSDADTAMTQTVEIGEDRSPNEGGVLTESTQTAPATTTTTAPAPPPPVAAKKKGR